MSNETSTEGKTAAAVLDRLREIARLLREGHLGPRAQHALAELVDELSTTLEKQALPDAERAHLTECATHLVESISQRQEKGLIVEARDRLEKAIIGAEARSPTLAGLVERLLDALASLGI